MKVSTDKGDVPINISYSPEDINPASNNDRDKELIKPISTAFSIVKFGLH